jgi:hypothetical protein
MAEGNKPDALEWLAYAEADLGVADHLSSQTIANHMLPLSAGC